MCKKRRFLIFCLALLSIAILFTACGKRSETPQKVDEQTTPITLTFYYPYDTGTDVAITEVTVDEELKENETILQKINHYLKNPEPKLEINPLPILGKDAQILSVDKQSAEIARVNVNRQFITQMNAGASFEEAIILSLVRTVAKNYDVEGVILQVENQAYESGHYAFGSDEVINAH